MSSNQLIMEPLNPDSAVHDRSGFSCGEEALNLYLATQAGQDMRRGFANVIVATRPGSAAILGYYTLSAALVDLTDLPEDLRRKMPRYGQAPAVLLGRLAVAESCQRQGLGALLLADAIKRALRSELAWAVFLVKAKHEQAAAFYKHFMLDSFAHDPLLLRVTRKDAEKIG
ncbi:MAG: GNAT family N-acetyltransferase [Deltaproteobacteria bacterium]|jgi:GNAT superfamily N-acetyltransferase|nr:GNAT family N-acetyltransferase [Deltaproteobacteria bacterium]